MIRYLETEEKGRCLDLWREAFPEDSTEFCDYYFKEKMKDNKVLVRQYLLWKIAHASLTAAVMAVLTGVLRFSIF